MHGDAAFCNMRCLILAASLFHFMVLSGGIKQRIQKDAAQKEAKPQGGQTAGKWIHSLWQKGTLSATELKRGARACASHDADCASWCKEKPKRTANPDSRSGEAMCHRDVVRALEKRTNMPPLYTTEGNFWDPILQKPIKALMSQ